MSIHVFHYCTSSMVQSLVSKSLEIGIHQFAIVHSEDRKDGTPVYDFSYCLGEREQMIGFDTILNASSGSPLGDPEARPEGEP